MAWWRGPWPLAQNPRDTVSFGACGECLLSATSTRQVSVADLLCETLTGFRVVERRCKLVLLPCTCIIQSSESLCARQLPRLFPLDGNLPSVAIHRCRCKCSTIAVCITVQSHQTRVGTTSQSEEDKTKAGLSRVKLRRSDGYSRIVSCGARPTILLVGDVESCRWQPRPAPSVGWPWVGPQRICAPLRIRLDYYDTAHKISSSCPFIRIRRPILYIQLALFHIVSSLIMNLPRKRRAWGGYHGWQPVRGQVCSCAHACTGRRR